jgi:hypothetical protein
VADLKTEKARRLSAKERVLARLRLGPATNLELNDICFRYGARILELRQGGHVIETEPGDKGVFLYRLGQPPPDGRLF